MEIVKYHNDINKIKLGNFTERELDIFFSLIFKLKNLKTDTITFEFSELKNLSGAKERSDSRLIKNAENISLKLIQLNQKIVLPDGDIEIFNLFRTFKISPKNKTLTVSINADFQYMLNDLIGNFTMFELKEFTTLRSGHSKTIFRILKQWQGTCKFVISLDAFKELLNTPETMTTSNFNAKVLKPIKTELETVFKNLEVTKLNKEKQPIKKGQKTIYLQFTWKKQEKKKQIEVQEVKQKSVTKYEAENPDFRDIQGKISKVLMDRGLGFGSEELQELGQLETIDQLQKFMKNNNIEN